MLPRENTALCREENLAVMAGMHMITSEYIPSKHPTRINSGEFMNVWHSGSRNTIPRGQDSFTSGVAIDQAPVPSDPLYWLQGTGPQVLHSSRHAVPSISGAIGGQEESEVLLHPERTRLTSRHSGRPRTRFKTMVSRSTHTGDQDKLCSERSTYIRDNIDHNVEWSIELTQAPIHPQAMPSQASCGWSQEMLAIPSIRDASAIPFEILNHFTEEGYPTTEPWSHLNVAALAPCHARSYQNQSNYHLGSPCSSTGDTQSGPTRWHTNVMASSEYVHANGQNRTPDQPVQRNSMKAHSPSEESNCSRQKSYLSPQTETRSYFADFNKQVGGLDPDSTCLSR